MLNVLANIGSLATCPANGSADDAGILDGALVAWRDDRIIFVGKESEERAGELVAAADQVVDARGALAAPGLIDCHTHLAFAGWRADEFSRRCGGESYLAIAASGGGIMRTVYETRRADIRSLLDRAEHFADKMLKLGVTTIECKSGYGLDVESELKLLEVYRRLDDRVPQQIVSTLLAAHVIPPEFRADAGGYVDLICNEIIPRTAKDSLASFCDAFVEEGAFSIEQARRILKTGVEHGLKPKLHVDQIRDGRGAELAAEIGAVSADHLEHASADGIRAIAEQGAVAVALPLASLYLQQPAMDARRFLSAGVNVAVSTDFNPGSAPCYNLPLAMSLACTMNRMSPAQAIRAATINAARAIDRHAHLGSIEIGKQADFVLVDAVSFDDWMYRFAQAPVRGVFIGGRKVV